MNKIWNMKHTTIKRKDRLNTKLTVTYSLKRFIYGNINPKCRSDPFFDFLPQFSPSFFQQFDSRPLIPFPYLFPLRNKRRFQVVSIPLVSYQFRYHLFQTLQNEPSRYRLKLNWPPSFIASMPFFNILINTC